MQVNAWVGIVICLLFLLCGLAIIFFFERFSRWLSRISLSFLQKIGLQRSNGRTEELISRWRSSWYYRIDAWFIKFMGIAMIVLSIYIISLIIFDMLHR